MVATGTGSVDELGQRRQVTALFYDLVGSTALAGRLDPEDFQQLQQRFHRAGSAAIEAAGGTLQALLGDGGVAFFGYPAAREDAAERAVEAGLAIVAACAALEPGAAAPRLQVRVGIATGEVIVSDPAYAGGRPEFVGLTPALAARLQAAAGPGTVLVAEETRRLVDGLFDVAPAGALALKGFAEPQQAWQVLRRRAAESRFSARHAGGLTPLVGRAAELAALERCWREACAGRGGVAVLSGEAGIGKSRLLAELAARAAPGGLRMSFQCSPQHVDTALHPVVARLERLLGLPTGEPAAVIRQRLERLVAPAAGRAGHVALLARLLGLPAAAADEPSPEEDPARLKERTLAALLEQLEAWTERQPVLFLLEDAHWIDPTTRLFLDRVVARAAALRLLVLVTLRPDQEAPWPEGGHVLRLPLGRMSEAESHALVRAQQAAGRLGGPEIARIVERADGIPLFLEELSAAVGAAPAAGEAAAIPATLADSLSARLDRLGPLKPVVLVASAIGRSFPVELLRAVAPAADVEAALDQVVGLGLAMRGTGPHARCTFKHALVQEAAYRGMLRREARRVHHRIAETLERDFAGTSEAAPEVLAFHFEAAGEPDRAVAWLQQAAEAAAQRSANREAARLVERGLKLLPALPEAADRDGRELALLTLLGPVQMALSGPGAAEVQALYERGIALARRRGPRPEDFPLFWGWWRVAPGFREMRERADMLIERMGRVDDEGLRLQAHHCQWATLFALAEHEACCAEIEQGLALYERGDYRAHGALYGGHDPRVCALAERALSVSLQGRPDAALADMAAALGHARSLAHQGSIAHALDAALCLGHYLHDHERVRDGAREAERFAASHGFPDLAARGRIFAGWAAARGGAAEAGAAQIRDGLEEQRRIGIEDDFPVFLEMLADACGRAGRPEQGLACLDEAVDIAGRSGLRFWAAELSRRRGRLLAQRRGAADGEALACLEGAAEVAAAQGARLLELRALASLVRALDPGARRSAALARLGRCRRACGPGEAAPDLRVALRLLAPA